MPNIELTKDEQEALQNLFQKLKDLSGFLREKRLVEQNQIIAERLQKMEEDLGNQITNLANNKPTNSRSINKIMNDWEEFSKLMENFKAPTTQQRMQNIGGKSMPAVQELQQRIKDKSPQQETQANKDKPYPRELEAHLSDLKKATIPLEKIQKEGFFKRLVRVVKSVINSIRKAFGLGKKSSFTPLQSTLEKEQADPKRRKIAELGQQAAAKQREPQNKQSAPSDQNKDTVKPKNK